MANLLAKVKALFAKPAAAAPVAATEEKHECCGGTGENCCHQNG